MQYSEYHFVSSDESTSEILLALLAEFGFDTFDLNETQVFAYIPSELIETNAIETKIKDLQTQFQFSYTSKVYEDKNWNEEWEKNFQPVIVAENILIRAPFHAPDSKYKYSLVIEPRMSFGTGHHESTYLMLEMMLKIEFDGKTICDAGCGTGILAIFAAQQGAKEVLAIDNNEWAYNNTLDNIALNPTAKNISVSLTELDIMRGKEFDIILANINKPIITESLPLFKNCLSINGTLLLSGILTKDLPDVIHATQANGFRLADSSTKSDWICIALTF
ncbi:MAG: 50S ribosomal protein L11 methyltransferase [Chitinophagales bacterium]